MTVIFAQPIWLILIWIKLFAVDFVYAAQLVDNTGDNMISSPHLTTRLQKHIPSLLKWPLKIMPFMLEQQLFDKIMTPLLKEAIAEGEMDFLTDKSLQIRVTDLDKSWHFTFAAEKLRLITAREPVDLSFTGPMNSFVLLASQKVDPDTLFFNRKLEIGGDTEMGLKVKNLVVQLDLHQLPLLFYTGLQQYSDVVLAQP